MIYIWAGLECSAAEMHDQIQCMIQCKGYFQLAQFDCCWAGHEKSYALRDALEQMSDDQGRIYFDENEHGASEALASAHERARLMPDSIDDSMALLLANPAWLAHRAECSESDLMQLYHLGFAEAYELRLRIQAELGLGRSRK